MKSSIISSRLCLGFALAAVALQLTLAQFPPIPVIPSRPPTTEPTEPTEPTQTMQPTSPTTPTSPETTTTTRPCVPLGEMCEVGGPPCCSVGLGIPGLPCVAERCL